MFIGNYYKFNKYLTLRIPNRLKWMKTKNSNETSKELQDIFPKSEWMPINKVLGGFGQIICKSRKPKCNICPIFKICKAEENSMKNKQIKKIQISKNKKKDEFIIPIRKKGFIF